MIASSLVAALGLPSAAEADETDRFEPATELNLLGLGGASLATGWVPAQGPIQVSFELHVGDTVRAEMLGEARYDWDAQTLSFVGDEGGGLFAVDVGVLLDARVRFDLLGMQYESELIGPYDLLVDGGTLFDPYLLPGNASRPALIDVATEPTEVYTYPLIDVLIASGELVVDAAFDVQIELSCASIEAAPDDGDPAWIVEELAAVPISAPSGDGLRLDATLRCTTVSTVTVLLYPSVQIMLGLQEFELSPFVLPVPVLVDDEAPLDFDPVALTFAAPEPAKPDDSGGEGGGEGSSGALDASGGMDTGLSAESTIGEGSGDTTGDDTGAASDAGCSCRSQQSPLSLGFLVMLLAGWRRRDRVGAATSTSA